MDCSCFYKKEGGMCFNPKGCHFTTQIQHRDEVIHRSEIETRGLKSRIQDLGGDLAVTEAAETKLIKEVAKLTAEQEVNDGAGAEQVRVIDRLTGEVEELSQRVCDLTDERDTAMLDIGFFSKQTDRVVAERDRAIVEITKYARECGGLQEQVRALLDGIGGLGGLDVLDNSYQMLVDKDRLNALKALAERMKP